METSILVSLILVVGLLASVGFAILMMAASAGRAAEGWHDEAVEGVGGRRSALPVRPVRRAPRSRGRTSG